MKDFWNKGVDAIGVLSFVGVLLFFGGIVFLLLVGAMYIMLNDNLSIWERVSFLGVGAMITGVLALGIGVMTEEE